MENDFDELRKRMIKSAKEKIKMNYESEEYALIQAINAYNEALKSQNLFYERLTEWYGLYFPEVSVSSPKALASLALILNSDRSIGKEAIESAIGDAGKAESIARKLEGSIGRLMGEEERNVIIEYAKLLLDMSDSIEKLDAYISAAVGRLLPNTAYITEDKIAAELLSKAGSMERLATFPASTVQLLGAEKALFKHIKFGSKPPKYGVIFKLPEVTNARKDLKGRIARLYATKIAMALKADYYTKNFIAEKLKNDISNGIKRISSSPIKEKPKREQRMGQNQHRKFDGKKRFHGRR
ncbi:MAG: NOP58 family protein [Candidatus Marsarchaeota archaeon]|nr:NOP58 family protein [Candidatus Marsarchaeota archaeon]